jgi:15-cis-phytoene synthase
VHREGLRVARRAGLDVVSALVQSESAAVARATIGEKSKSFAMASALLGARLRDQTAVVYTYCRRADDAVDESSDPATALTRLRTELDAVYATARCIAPTIGDAPVTTAEDRPISDPVLATFAAICAERRIPRAYPEELLAGMAMDVDDTRYETLAQLGVYCFRVAGVVGLMMCHVFGLRDDDALVPAARLGLGMQLTNICRDVAEDWNRGRLYLPDEILAPHGLGGLAGDLGKPLPASARAPLATCVLELLDLADEHYRAADRGVPLLPWRAALAVRAARRIYCAIGGVLRARGGDALAGRAVVSTGTKVLHAGAAAGRTLIAWPGRAFARRARVPTRILTPDDVGLGR